MASPEKPTMDELWAKAQQRFQDRTGKELQISPPKTLDKVREDIEDLAAKKDVFVGEERKRRFKDNAMGTLYCLKLLGGVAAQGASMAFGPASLCFNAASLLLDIPKQIHDFHELVDSIFEEVTGFLYNFKVYQRIEQFTKIEPDLVDTVHELMMSFVDLCALSIQANRGGFFKRLGRSAKKVLMDDDLGIGKELDHFRLLSQRQSAVQETLTLEGVLKMDGKLARVLNIASDTSQKIVEMKTDVEFLTSAERDRKLEQIEKAQREKIAKKLPVRKENAQVSEARCTEAWDDSVQKTGDWLRDNQDYVAWADGSAVSNPLLLLTGDNNTGKSYLVSAIKHDLQAARATTHPTTAKLAVAYYFFPKWAEKAAKAGQDQRPAETALKCMSLQISEGDATYAKSLAAFCDSKDEGYFKDLTLTDLWRDLKFVGAKQDTSYFLLFDGLDQVPEDSRRELLKVLAVLPRLPEAERAQIRVLLSGRGDTFKNNVPDTTPTIDIERENHSEIRRFIERKLKEDNLLQGSDNTTAALRKLVFDDLSGLGNYFKVQSALEKINAKIDADGGADDVRKIVAEAGQDSAAIAQNLKDELGDILSAKEIEELNELLIWVIHGVEYLNVERLQAALFLRFKTTSLKPLQKKLEGKYAKVFDIDGDGDVSVNSDLEEVLTSDKPRGLAIEEAPKISATITITNAGMRTVQNFLWTLCEKAMINEFKFDNTTAAIVSKPSIGVNEFDAHLTILQRSLNVLLGDPDEKTACLIPYMLGYLPDHLDHVMEALSQNELPAAEKRDIGSGVYAIFVDGEILERHGPHLAATAVNWMESEPGIPAFWKWLTDKDAIGYLGKKDKEWLNQINSSPNRNQALLQPVAVMVAKHWLQKRDWDVEHTYGWISDFLNIKTEDDSEASDTGSERPVDTDNVSTTGDDKGSNAGSSHGHNSDTGSTAAPSATTAAHDDVEAQGEDKDVTESEDVQRVLKAAKWAQEALQIKETDSLWNERLGQTYLTLNETQAAISVFQKAQELDPSSWRSIEGLALAHAEEKQYSQAVSEMKQVIDHLKGEDKIEEAERQKIMLRILMNLADYYTELEDATNAMECYQSASKLEPEDSKVQFHVLKLLLRTNQDTQARQLIDEMAEKKAEHSDVSQLGAALQLLIADEAYDILFGMLFTTTQRNPAFSKVIAALQTATEFAQLEARAKDQATLLLYTGIAIYHYDQSETRNPEAALELWEQCGLLKGKGSSWKLYLTCMRAVRLISSFHFHQAKSLQNPVFHVEKMEQIATDNGKYPSDPHTKKYLGCYYARVLGDRSKARGVFLNDMIDAVGLLSDEEDWNDYLGFYRLADIFMHYGDDVNALSAWSMIGPHTDSAGMAKDHPAQSTQEGGPKNDRSGPLQNSCDGRCGKTWTFADDFRCCLICPDVQLCEDCLWKLKAGTLKRFVCNASHEWLHVPKWDDNEHGTAGVGKIKVGGSIENGVRVGGELVPVEDWLNTIRDEWGIPRPAKKDVATATEAVVNGAPQEEKPENSLSALVEA